VLGMRRQSMVAENAGGAAVNSRGQSEAEPSVDGREPPGQPLEGRQRVNVPPLAGLGENARDAFRGLTPTAIDCGPCGAELLKALDHSVPRPRPASETLALNWRAACGMTTSVPPPGVAR